MKFSSLLPVWLAGVCMTMTAGVVSAAYREDDLNAEVVARVGGVSMVGPKKS